MNPTKKNLLKEVGAPLKHHFASQKIFFDSPDLEA